MRARFFRRLPPAARYSLPVAAALVLAWLLSWMWPRFVQAPETRACQSAVEYLTASTTATRIIARDGPRSDNGLRTVRLDFEFRNVFAGQRPGNIVCTFAPAKEAQPLQLARVEVDGQVLDDSLAAELNAHLAR